MKTYYCKERRFPSLLMAQRDNVLVPLTKGGKSNKRERIWKRYIHGKQVDCRWREKRKSFHLLHVSTYIRVTCEDHVRGLVSART
jgi:hypothetical protein